MRRAGVPDPTYWQHGPDSVVFEWEQGKKSLYITISDKHISACISDPNGILHRETLA